MLKSIIRGNVVATMMLALQSHLQRFQRAVVETRYTASLLSGDLKSSLLTLPVLVVVLAGLAACSANTPTSGSMANAPAAVPTAAPAAAIATAMPTKVPSAAPTAQASVAPMAMPSKAPAAAATAAPAAAITAGTLQINDPWTRAVGAGMTGAVYFTVRNTGNTPDRLVKAQSNAAKAVEMHTTEMANGVMSMHPVDAYDIPAGGELTLKPGGNHIMLIGMNKDVKADDTVTLTLQFEKAGPVEVTLKARNP
ncbi:MAG: copper chaperone PCu(A)C [Anaerolineae bacterium]